MKELFEENVMNAKIMKDTKKAMNFIKNILFRNTTVNFYYKNDKGSVVNSLLIFFVGKLKSPIKAKNFYQREKFDETCQYNVEFNFYESKDEHVEIKKHYNFSQNYLRISFYFDDYHKMYNVISMFHNEFNKYKVIEDKRIKI
jgi:hypothetical protein